KGKCDTLEIHNPFYLYYLKKKCADMLIQILPNLDKKIWFESLRLCYDNVIENEENENGHIVHAGRYNISVKHVSRPHEIVRKY
ncbi:hypothetical protein PMAYCL1PPCAC_00577, partial [Pristionchus mayeri]